MDRRHFLQSMAAATAALAVMDAKATPAPLWAAVKTAPLADVDLSGYSLVCHFDEQGKRWAVYEDWQRQDGALVFSQGQQALVLTKRLEATFAGDTPPYLGMALSKVALSDADLLADALLANGEPDETAVRTVAPPLASKLNPADYGGRLPWNSFVGTRQCNDTMMVYPNGRTRTYHPRQVLKGAGSDELAAKRFEGLVGGWMPAVHKVVPLGDGRYYELLVFADVDATDTFIAQTWHRSALMEKGKVLEVHYAHSYPAYPPRREPPPAADFYRALLRFAGYWQQQLADMAPCQLPDPSWSDMARFAFARELVVRPGGTYPKYGAVDRDYYGPEYDGFQDTFTSSLYANLEWGRFAQASAVLDQYFSDFVYEDGMINMRGPETGQFGLTLSLLARYFQLTGDKALLQKHRGKIAATAALLLELHDAALALPKTAPGYGLIHGWNESDACLFEDPSIWWKPYYANSAMTVRGLVDIAAIWPQLGGEPALAARWRQRAATLKARLETSIRANIRHDMSPPYIGPLPGVALTFRQALAQQQPSEQGWPHRVYAELLHADVLPADLANLVIDCMRAYGATSIGVVANITAPNDKERNLLGFISYGYALQLLRLGRVDEYLLFMYAHRYHAHTPGSWTAGEVSDITGGMPLFCMPAQLTIPLLLRWALVFDDGPQLHLAKAVPHAWWQSGKTVACEAIPTPWGKVGYRLQLHLAEGRLSGTVTLPQKLPEVLTLTLRLPKGQRWQQLLVGGQPAEALGQDCFVIRGKAGQVLAIEGRLG
ncbi:Tat pathway signal protein [Gallaecimonas pentaromativorans]|uniref:Secreted protein n=1 Tax=Gallaecimonas pentaromativorans TaxID=584787 RepID=A0A3N1P6G3_9GAMM|nr:Tat pathway signal protein [Gallaecimonas pentaromativorans]ROQ23268.1 hypothetical protein EDC28_1086 [Gallaecimonas pentaromativorans]